MHLIKSRLVLMFRGIEVRQVLILGLCALLVACDDTPVDSAGVSSETVKLEAFCNMPGLPPAIRETLLVVDAGAINAASPESFREENPALFETVIGLVDPDRAVSSGAMAPRERITIAVASPQTGGLSEIFAGCLPALSKDEMAKRAASGEDGFMDAYFGLDLASKLAEARAEFKKKASLMVAQIKPSDGAKSGADFNSSSFGQVFRIIGPGVNERGRVRRLVVFSDPGTAMAYVPADFAEARKVAFEQAEKAEVNLGMSELYLIPVGRTLNDVQRGYLDAWFLGNGADLRHVGSFSPNAFGKPPVKIVTYRGELPLSSEVSSPMELRLPTASDASLSGAWITYTGSKGIRRTPISGQFMCSPDGCELRSNPEGNHLGQRWRTLPGAQPQPLFDGPFGGMRLISGTGDETSFKGRIHDPIIYVGDKGDIAFTAKRAD